MIRRPASGRLVPSARFILSIARGPNVTAWYLPGVLTRISTPHASYQLGASKFGSSSPREGCRACVRSGYRPRSQGAPLKQRSPSPLACDPGQSRMAHRRFDFIPQRAVIWVSNRHCGDIVMHNSGWLPLEPLHFGDRNTNECTRPKALQTAFLDQLVDQAIGASPARGKLGYGHWSGCIRRGCGHPRIRDTIASVGHFPASIPVGALKSAIIDPPDIALSSAEVAGRFSNRISAARMRSPSQVRTRSRAWPSVV